MVILCNYAALSGFTAISLNCILLYNYLKKSKSSGYISILENKAYTLT